MFTNGLLALCGLAFLSSLRAELRETPQLSRRLLNGLPTRRAIRNALSNNIAAGRRTH